MIKKECMTAEWIKSISVRNKYKDLNLIEKVIRAMYLLEMLKLSGYPFCFKGGSALMLILGESAHRLSIDIDIICPPGTDIEPYLKDIEKFGFYLRPLMSGSRGTRIFPRATRDSFITSLIRTMINLRIYCLMSCTRIYNTTLLKKLGLRGLL